jgi:hypothetical protein
MSFGCSTGLVLDRFPRLGQQFGTFSFGVVINGHPYFNIQQALLRLGNGDDGLNLGRSFLKWSSYSPLSPLKFYFLGVVNLASSKLSCLFGQVIYSCCYGYNFGCLVFPWLKLVERGVGMDYSVTLCGEVLDRFPNDRVIGPESYQ